MCPLSPLPKRNVAGDFTRDDLGGKRRPPSCSMEIFVLTVSPFHCSGLWAKNKDILDAIDYVLIGYG